MVSLHLELCQIREVEAGAFSGMPRLFYLYLSHNALTVLGPGAFRGAPALTYLHLEGNRLAAFPAAGGVTRGYWGLGGGCVPMTTRWMGAQCRGPA